MTLNHSETTLDPAVHQFADFQGKGRKPFCTWLNKECVGGPLNTSEPGLLGRLIGARWVNKAKIPAPCHSCTALSDRV